jgi:hypothetical protein
MQCEARMMMGLIRDAVTRTVSNVFTGDVKAARAAGQKNSLQEKKKP